jgi:hypothetical protein
MVDRVTIVGLNMGMGHSDPYLMGQVEGKETLSVGSTKSGSNGP